MIMHFSAAGGGGNDFLLMYSMQSCFFCNSNQLTGPLVSGKHTIII